MVSDRAVSKWFSRGMICAGLALSVVSAASPAFADPSASDKESARALMSQGDKAYDAKDYVGALKAYQGAHALMHVPGTGIWVAKSELALGHLVEAREAAIEVTRMAPQANEPAAFAKARSDADELARSLASRIPSLQIKVEGAPAGAKVAIKLDGEELPSSVVALPRKVNPGKHSGVASAPGQRDAAAEISVNEGESATLQLKFGVEGAAGPPPVAVVPGPAPEVATPPPSQPPPDDAKRGLSPLVPIGFIAGGVGVGVGAVFGIISLGKASDVKKSPCVTKGTVCQNDVRNQYNSANTLGWVSDIGFAVGVIGAGVGVVGLVTGGKSSSSNTKSGSTKLFVGPGKVGLNGSF